MPALRISWSCKLLFNKQAVSNAAVLVFNKMTVLLRTPPGLHIDDDPPPGLDPVCGLPPGLTLPTETNLSTSKHQMPAPPPGLQQQTIAPKPSPRKRLKKKLSQMQADCDWRLNACTSARTSLRGDRLGRDGAGGCFKNSMASSAETLTRTI